MTGDVEDTLNANASGRTALAVGGAAAPVLYRYAVERAIGFAFDRLTARHDESLLNARASDVEHMFHGEHASGGAQRTRVVPCGRFARLYRPFPGLDFEVKRVLVRC